MIYLYIVFQACETRVEKDKTEITKKCTKEKNCKASCDPKDKFCVTCCKGSLCNENEGKDFDRSQCYMYIIPLFDLNLLTIMITKYSQHRVVCLEAL